MLQVEERREQCDNDRLSGCSVSWILTVIKDDKNPTSSQNAAICVRIKGFVRNRRIYIMS